MCYIYIHTHTHTYIYNCDIHVGDIRHKKERNPATCNNMDENKPDTNRQRLHVITYWNLKKSNLEEQ